MSAREREVRQCAADLLARFGIKGPPVDPDWIVRRQGLKIRTIREDQFPPGVFSALWKQGDRFGIVVSKSCPTTEHRRFSVAHELGHYNLDGHMEQTGAVLGGTIAIAERLGGDREAQFEDEANWFASELLAPAAHLAPRVARVEPSIESVRGLADDFGTSLTMMAYRYAELTDRILAAVCCFEGFVERVFLSESLRNLDWHGSLTAGNPVPEGTLTSSLTQTGYLPSGQARPSPGMAHDWFIGAPAGLEIQEDAVYLSGYERVLTLLIGKRGMSSGS